MKKTYLIKILLSMICYISLTESAECKIVRKTINNITYECNTETGKAQVTRINAEDVTIPAKIEVVTDSYYNSETHTYENVIQEFNVNDINIFWSKVCKRIKAFHIETITSVQGSSALEDFQWGESLKEIKERAFVDCPNLFKNSGAKFPKNLEKIGKDAFWGCKGMGYIDLSACVKLKEISDYAFAGCGEYIMDENNNLIGYRGPESLSLNLGLEKIGVGAFSCCYNLSNPILILPKTVKEVGSQAFTMCNSLKNINFNEVEILGEGVASNCKNLEEASFKAINSIPDWCFSGCIKLQRVYFNNLQIHTIGQFAFLGCDLPGKFDLPAGLKLLKRGAFCRNNFSQVTYDGFRPVEEEDCWLDCNYLKGVINRSKKKISVASSRTNESESIKIGRYAYAGCLNLESLPEDFDEVENGAFISCPKVETLTYPLRQKEISKEATESYINNLYDDRALCNHLDELFSEAEESDYYWYLEIISQIGYYHNIWCMSKPTFSEVRFHEYVESIGKDCVASYPIKKVVFGSEYYDEYEIGTTLTIEADAFSTNNGIDSVITYYSNPPILSPSAFSNTVYNTATLKVPEEAISTYRSTEGWKLFKNITSASTVPEIFTTPKNNNVYGIDGILIIKSATEEQIKSLSPGIYIVNGKKRFIH